VFYYVVTLTKYSHTPCPFFFLLTDLLVNVFTSSFLLSEQILLVKEKTEHNSMVAHILNRREY
jgi:hypothetical protein